MGVAEIITVVLLLLRWLGFIDLAWWKCFIAEYFVFGGIALVLLFNGVLWLLGF